MWLKTLIQIIQLLKTPQRTQQNSYFQHHDIYILYIRDMYTISQYHIYMIVCYRKYCGPHKIANIVDITGLETLRITSLRVTQGVAVMFHTLVLLMSTLQVLYSPKMNSRWSYFKNVMSCKIYDFLCPFSRFTHSF